MEDGGSYGEIEGEGWKMITALARLRVKGGRWWQLWEN